MVPRDHHGADAGAFGPGYRLLRLFARRVDHADYADEDQLLLDAVVRLRRGLWRERPEGDAEGPERLAREPLGRGPSLRPSLCGQQPGFVAGDLVGAAREEDVRRALDEQDTALGLLCVLVDRTHHLALGRERHLANALEASVERFLSEPNLARGHDQGSLGGITLHAPAAIVVAEGRVVRLPSPPTTSLAVIRYASAWSVFTVCGTACPVALYSG
jgi:hypothetical protein